MATPPWHQDQTHHIYTILASFFLLAFSLHLSKANGHLQLKETNLTFYIQDYVGTNGTTALVTGIAGREWSFFSFGTIYVSDDPVTVGPQKDSPHIGRVQGLYTISSPDAVYGFTNQEYNGSTLEIQGRAFNLATHGQTFGEIAVTGGTGKFRFASGFAIIDVISYDTTLLYSVLRCNITVLHY